MYKKILVPIDGSPASLRGLQEALKVARSDDAVLRVLHIVNELVMGTPYAPSINYGALMDSLREGGRKTLAASETQVQAAGVKGEGVLLETLGQSAAQAIVEQAKQWPADLIVMGTHGRRGLRRLVMGSDAENVLRNSPVPVLMVREPDDAATSPPRAVTD